MSTPDPISAVMDYTEDDPKQGVSRSYTYYKSGSYDISTKKQDISILHSPYWGKMLFLDGTLQSTTKDEVIYHNALVHPLMDVLSEKSKILILGGGEGATAREVLRWSKVREVLMIDYDKELVELMRGSCKEWSLNAFQDRRLNCVYDDAWNAMKGVRNYNGIIIDLTDPDLKKEKWLELLTMVMERVKPLNGAFVMNAGLYLPWKVDQIKELKDLVEDLCHKNNSYKYYIYTAMIPSFSGEWTFIVVYHNSNFITEPEFLNIIPQWIRRSIRTLPNSLIDTAALTFPDFTPIH